jgi:hypothetical protein
MFDSQKIKLYINRQKLDMSLNLSVDILLIQIAYTRLEYKVYIVFKTFMGLLYINVHFSSYLKAIF